MLMIGGEVRYLDFDTRCVIETGCCYRRLYGSSLMSLGFSSLKGGC